MWSAPVGWIPLKTRSTGIAVARRNGGGTVAPPPRDVQGRPVPGPIENDPPPPLNPTRSVPSPRSRGVPLRLALPTPFLPGLALTACLPACALPPREVHLAPLFSVHRTAGGGREVEALAGILRWKEDAEGTEIAARPVFRRYRKGEERGGDFLFPLGLDRLDPESHEIGRASWRE